MSCGASVTTPALATAPAEVCQQPRPANVGNLGSLGNLDSLSADGESMVTTETGTPGTSTLPAAPLLPGIVAARLLPVSQVAGRDWGWRTCSRRRTRGAGAG